MNHYTPRAVYIILSINVLTLCVCVCLSCAEAGGDMNRALRHEEQALRREAREVRLYSYTLNSKSFLNINTSSTVLWL